MGLIKGPKKSCLNDLRVKLIYTVFEIITKNRPLKLIQIYDVTCTPQMVGMSSGGFWGDKLIGYLCFY